MKRITPTVPFREFKKRGYTFQRLFGWNYNTYQKKVGGKTIWVWQRNGGSVEINDWYGHTHTIVKFADEHREQFKKSEYLRIKYNRHTEKIELHSFKKEYIVTDENLINTGYYKGYDEITFTEESLNEIVKELKEISDFI